MKKIYIDTETTGLRDDCGLTQIAGVIEIEGAVREVFDLRVKPFPFDYREKEAYEMTSLDWSVGLEPEAAHTDLARIFRNYVDPFDTADKFTVYAYGVLFDMGVLRRWFEGNNDKYFGSWFWTPGVCIMSQAAEFLKEDRYKMENFKLRSVCEFLELDAVKEWHNARQDIAAAYELKNVINPGDAVNENLNRVAEFAEDQPGEDEFYSGRAWEPKTIIT